MIAPINSLALEDLPIKLLQKLDLGRPMLNHIDERNRPACAGFEINFRFESRADLGAIEAVALRFCKSCPLLGECAAYANERKEEGLWGGVYRRKSRSRSYETVDLLTPLQIAASA